MAEGGVSRTLYLSRVRKVTSGIDRLKRRELKLGPGRSGAARVMQLNGAIPKNVGIARGGRIGGGREGRGRWRKEVVGSSKLSLMA